MALSKRPRTLPVAFAGPFLIEATETQELVPNAFGKIKFKAFAADLPEAIASRLNGVYIQNSDDAQKATLAIPALKGGDGSSLDSNFRSFFPVRASQSSVQMSGYSNNDKRTANVSARSEIAKLDVRVILENRTRHISVSVSGDSSDVLRRHARSSARTRNRLRHANRHRVRKVHGTEQCSIG